MAVMTFTRSRCRLPEGAEREMAPWLGRHSLPQDPISLVYCLFTGFGRGWLICTDVGAAYELRLAAIGLARFDGDALGFHALHHLGIAAPLGLLLPGLAEEFRVQVVAGFTGGFLLLHHQRVGLGVG